LLLIAVAPVVAFLVTSKRAPPPSRAPALPASARSDALAQTDETGRPVEGAYRDSPLACVTTAKSGSVAINVTTQGLSGGTTRTYELHWSSEGARFAADGYPPPAYQPRPFDVFVSDKVAQRIRNDIAFAFDIDAYRSDKPSIAPVQTGLTAWCDGAQVIKWTGPREGRQWMGSTRDLIKALRARERVPGAVVVGSLLGDAAAVPELGVARIAGTEQAPLYLWRDAKSAPHAFRFGPLAYSRPTLLAGLSSEFAEEVSPWRKNRR